MIPFHHGMRMQFTLLKIARRRLKSKSQRDKLSWVLTISQLRKVRRLLRNENRLMLSCLYYLRVKSWEVKKWANFVCRTSFQDQGKFLSEIKSLLTWNPKRSSIHQTRRLMILNLSFWNEKSHKRFETILRTKSLVCLNKSQLCASIIKRLVKR